MISNGSQQVPPGVFSWMISTSALAFGHLDAAFDIFQHGGMIGPSAVMTMASG